MEAVVATDNMTFAFPGGPPVFESIALRAPAGSAFGILGPNGAGKSTLLKVILGLLRPQKGAVRLFGQSLHYYGKPTLLARVGSLIEGPRLYPHLSGYDNLRVFTTYRKLPVARIEEVLALVKMGRHAARRVRTYSTGMRQRLALALALLPDPDLLILDEPTNGLDPEGIVLLRDLIRRLNREEGKTVLLSSHLLSEVEQICSHVAVIGQGRLLFQGRMENLREKRGEGITLEMELGALTAQQHRTLSAALTGRRFEWLPPRKLRLTLPDREAIPQIIDRLRTAGLPVYQVIICQDRLEQYFLELYQNSGDDV